MAKYKCQGGCDYKTEVKDGDKVPECCGKPMVKMGKDEEDTDYGCGCCG